MLPDFTFSVNEMQPVMLETVNLFTVSLSQVLEILTNRKLKVGLGRLFRTQ